MKVAAILLAVVFAGCNSVTSKIAEIDLDNFCHEENIDPKAFRSMRPGKGVPARHYNDIRDSNRVCRDHLTSVATENGHQAAMAENTRIESAIGWGIGGGVAGALLALILVLL